jgi:hypothetical protein
VRVDAGQGNLVGSVAADGQPPADACAMSPHPPPPPDSRRRSADDDFDWPPPQDDLSIHDLDGAPWSNLQAASNEAFAHRHGEPVPLRRAPRASRAQLAIVVGMSAVLTVAAGWALRDAMRYPVALIAGDVPTPPTTPPTTTVVPAPAQAPPPRLTVVATYPVTPARPAAEPPPPIAPELTLAHAAPAVEEPRPVAATSTEVPLVSGPAIDEVTITPASIAADAVAAPAAPPMAPWSARADDDIRELLRRYEAAYDRRDVATAATLWPSLDQRALSHAFASLDRQDVSFEHCDIDASGPRGSAVCVGTLRYVPRVGRGVERAGRITWTFDLTHSGEDWRISRLRAR